jgi:hypothetical protein
VAMMPSTIARRPNRATLGVFPCFVPDNLYSGIVSRLFKNHGQMEFLQRWFQAIPLLRPAEGSPAAARDNFFLAACHAANADLTTYFEADLNWPISAEARARVPAMLVSVVVLKCAALLYQGVNPYPISD